MTTILSMTHRAAMVSAHVRCARCAGARSTRTSHPALASAEVAVDAPKRGKKKKKQKRDVWNANQKCKSLQVARPVTLSKRLPTARLPRVCQAVGARQKVLPSSSGLV